MSSQVTYTGVHGPAREVTEMLFPDVRQFALDFEKKTLQLNHVDAGGQPKEIILDMAGETVTLTDTITGNQHVIAISVA